jgi:hypothetical protein
LSVIRGLETAGSGHEAAFPADTAEPPVSAHCAHSTRLSQPADDDPTLRWGVGFDHDHRESYFL